jgi:hypothetical protein
MRMRLGVFATTAVASLLAAPLWAQSLTELAAKERQKRAAKAESGKTYTDEDLGRAKGTSATFPTGDQGTASEAPSGASSEGQAGAPAAGAAEAEKSPEQQRADQQKTWRDRLAAARQKVQQTQQTIDQIQSDLNDTSSMYSPGRARRVETMEKKKQELVAAQQETETLLAEGRRNGFRE